MRLLLNQFSLQNWSCIPAARHLLDASSGVYMYTKVRFCAGILIAILLSLTACSASATPVDKPAIDLSGVWQGEIRVIPCAPGMPAENGRCDGVNRITFNLHQNDSEVTGDYRCAIGTTVCRSENTTVRGKLIDGSVRGRNVTLRVLLPGDLSSCLYNGSDSATQIGGSYRCYQGGGLVETGQWQVRRGVGERNPLPSRPE